MFFVVIVIDGEKFGVYDFWCVLFVLLYFNGFFGFVKF